MKELFEFFVSACNDPRSEAEPNFFRLCTPINDDQGWVIEYVWAHHDGDIVEKMWDNENLEILLAEVKQFIDKELRPPIA